MKNPCSNLPEEKPQMENPNPNDLPEEILLEIFYRLPVKSVGRCRCLSKSWNRNLSTSQFITSHHTSATNQQDLTLLLEDHRALLTIRLPFDENYRTVPIRKLDLPAMNVVGSCNGLVLLVDGYTIVVVNPITLQQVTIQNTRGVAAYGFGYDIGSDDYKIVKVSTTFQNTPGVAAHGFGFCRKNFDAAYVYSMKKGIWKRVNDFPFNIFSHAHGVFVNGAIHWLVKTSSSNDDGYVIAAFDVATDSFHAIPVPNKVFNQHRLFGIRGCLLIGDQTDFVGRDVWIMEEYGQVKSWTKWPGIRPHANYFLSNPLCAIGDDEILLTCRDMSLIMWKLTDDRTTKNVIVNGGLHSFYSGCTFVNSLVSPVQYSVASRLKRCNRC